MKRGMLSVWPLRTEQDYLQAREIVDRLAVKGEDRLTGQEQNQLEVFSILIDNYEQEHFSIDPVRLSPLEFLGVLMRENGMNPSELGRLLGERTLGHKILNGDRGLSKAHIRILSDHFKVDAGAFL